MAAYRFPYLMLGDALVFKQTSDFFEHFYRQMEPNVHYIPLKHDLSDVVEKIKWAQTHDDEVGFILYFVIVLIAVEYYVSLILSLCNVQGY